MRITAALILFVLTVWRGYLDWQASAGLAEGVDLATLAEVWQGIAPASYEPGATWLLTRDILPAWPQVVTAVLAAPALPVFFGLAVFFFAIRRRGYPPELAYSR